MKILILMLASLAFCEKDFSIVNLDDQTSGNDASFLSDSMTNYYQNNKATYQVEEVEQEEVKKLTLQGKNIVTLVMAEIYSVIIDTMQFLDKNRKPIENYSLSTIISNEIIPQNYYQGHNSTEDNLFTTCKYYNGAPAFQTATINRNVSSVVNSQFHNFWISENKVQVSQLSSNYELLNVTDITINDFTNPEKLFYPQPYYHLGTGSPYIFIVGTNSTNNNTKTLILSQILEETKSMIKLSEFAALNCSDFCGAITSITYDSNYFFVSSSSGLHYYNRNDLSRTDDNTTGSIKDIIVNKNVLYAITNEGVRIFQIRTLKWDGSNIFNHGRLVKFDYVLYDRKISDSTYFVGISVDNDPPKNREVLIELIASEYYETNPKINKIILSSSQIKVEDIATDNYNYYSYILDRESKNLYLITRGTPNFRNSFNYKVDLSKEIASVPETSNNDFLFLLSDNVSENAPNLGIKTGSSLYVFGPIIHDTQALRCVFLEKGEYYQTFRVGEDCSKSNEPGLKGCEKQVTFKLSIDEKRNFVGVWVVLVIVIVVVITLIVFTVFCFLRKRSRKASAVNTVIVKERNQEMPEVKGEGTHEVLEEINLDNKL